MSNDALRRPGLAFSNGDSGRPASVVASGRGRGPTGRTVAVLDFLAAHPEETFTMSELSRQTGVSKATLHDIIRVLVDSDYLRRTDGTLFGLGPSLIRLGTAALGSHRMLIDVASPLLVGLAARLGAQAIISAEAGEDMVILRRVGARTSRNRWYEEGERIPLKPPMGTVFKAWSPDEQIETWLRKSDSLGVEREAHIRQALAATRERGFALGLTVSARRQLQEVLAGLDTGGTVDTTRFRLAELLTSMEDQQYLPGDLDGTARVRIDWIGCPIFDARGSVIAAVNVAGFVNPIVERDIPALGRQILTVRDTIMRELHGAPPR